MHIEVEGMRLWFDVEGASLVPEGARMRERPTVVLLHGGPGSFDHSYLKPDFVHLADLAQVVYLDLPGHGRSEWGTPADWSIEKCADDVLAFCDGLGIARPVVFGHSLGGFVAMLYAARYPGHPAALVLQSTFGRFDLGRLVSEFRRAGGDEVAEIAERFYGGDRASVSLDEWARCRRLFGPSVLSDEERARIFAHHDLNEPGLQRMREFDAIDLLGTIECPTLVCAGELDPVAPVKAAQELADALPSEHTRLEVIPGGGHFTWKDAPEEYWALVTEFVETATGVEPAGSY
jgi:proline iminopeptidase